MDTRTLQLAGLLTEGKNNGTPWIQWFKDYHDISFEVDKLKKKDKTFQGFELSPESFGYEFTGTRGALQYAGLFYKGTRPKKAEQKAMFAKIAARNGWTPVIKESVLEEGKKTIVDRIYGEVMSALGKSVPGLSASAKKAIRDGIQDAYDEGCDAGYEEANN